MLKLDAMEPFLKYRQIYTVKNKNNIICAKYYLENIYI